MDRSVLLGTKTLVADRYDLKKTEWRIFSYVTRKRVTIPIF